MATTPPTNPPSPKQGGAPRGPKIGDKFKEKHAGQLTENLEIKDPDAIQQGMVDVWGWVEDNATALIAALSLLVAVGIIYVIVNAYQDHRERKAQDAYFAVESKYDKIKEGFDKAKFKALQPEAAKAAEKKADKKVDDEKPATGDLAKDYGSVLGDLERVAHDNDGTAAGAQAALVAAKTYLDYKQPDKAIELAALPVKSLGSKHLLSHLARVLWGSALATKGDCAQAVKVWQEVLDDKSAVYLQGETALRSGLCYETMNQPDQAAEMYRRVSTDASAGGAPSPSAATAKGLLRALEIKKGPATASAPAAGAPASAPAKKRMAE